MVSIETKVSVSCVTARAPPSDDTIVQYPRARISVVMGLRAADAAEEAHMFRTAIDIADEPVVDRRADVRRLLVERRQELLNEIRSRVRDARQEAAGATHHATQHDEAFEAEPEDDLAFALIQMKAETLERVNAAVRQVDEGTYGYCVDCGDAIASSRLRALPFAVRCRDCEETREHEQHRVRVRSHRVSSELNIRH